MRVRKSAACLLLAALYASRRGHAQSAPSTPPVSAAPAAPVTAVAPGAIAPLPLALSLGPSKLDPEAVRRAVELELGRPVALTKAGSSSADLPGDSAQGLTVVVRADHTVSVSYHAANGVTRSRSIGLPRDEARAPEVIALLSGNLSRDEAAELLATLAARATPKPADPVAAAPDEAKGEPAKQPEPSARQVPKPVAPTHKKTDRMGDRGDLLIAPYPLFDLTLVHPISLVPKSERYVVNGELGLVYSKVGALEGAGLNVMILSTERNVHGFSYATFYNRTGGTVYGLTASALLNDANAVEGSAVSGLVNWSRAGRGVQAAGILNVTDAFVGVQCSGIANIAHEIRGAQIGVVNIAGNVNGIQLGVVNVAKHVDGTSLGLVSVAGNGRVQAVFWGSTFMPLDAAAKFIVGSFYTQLGAGYQPSDHTYIYELGLGAHVPLGRFFVEPGVHYSEQRDAKRAFSQQQTEHVHYRLAAGLDLHAVSPFVGVAVLQRFAHESGAADPRLDGFAGVAFF